MKDQSLQAQISTSTLSSPSLQANLAESSSLRLSTNKSPIGEVPTTELNIDRLKMLCRPVFEEAQGRNRMIAWVGIFGSVQRGTQRPDSDIDVLVGFLAKADYLEDVCHSYVWLQERLPKALGREVDLVLFTHNYHSFGYIQLESLLTAETIWGDATWVQLSRAAAEQQLREGYKIIMQALEIASSLHERVLQLTQGKFASPENKSLRLSILKDALSVIITVKTMRRPFEVLQRMMPQFLDKENVIRAAVEGKVKSCDDIIWSALSDETNVIALTGMVEAMEQTFDRAGLTP